MPATPKPNAHAMGQAKPQAAGFLGRLSRWTDAAIEAVAPGWAARRIMARDALAAYRGVGVKANDPLWSAQPYGPNAIASEGELGPFARHRALLRRHWLPRSAAMALQRGVVRDGISCRPNALDPRTGQPLEKFNKRMGEVWGWWSRNPKACHVAGRLTLRDQLAIAMSETLATGNPMWLTSYEPKRRAEVPGLRLQPFEVEELATDGHPGVEPEAGNVVRHGVEVDALGAIVAYWMLPAHPHDAAMGGWGRGYPAFPGMQPAERIPEDRVLRFAQYERFGAVLAAPGLSPVTDVLRSLQGYEDATQQRARMLSFLGLVIETNAGSLPNTGSSGDSPPKPGMTAGAGTGNTRAMRFEPGSAVEVARGESVKPVQAAGALDDYEPYTKQQIVQAAAGTGMDFMLLTRNFGDGSYSAQRQAMLENYANWDMWHTLIVEQFLQPLYERLLLHALAEGIVEAPRGMFVDPRVLPAYMVAEWQAPKRPWVDPLKEAAAAQVLLNLGLTNHASLLNVLGVDWRENLQETAQIAKAYQDAGLPTPWLGVGDKGGANGPTGNGLRAALAKLDDLDEGERASLNAAIAGRVCEWVAAAQRAA